MSPASRPKVSIELFEVVEVHENNGYGLLLARGQL